jgi:hypothetical protein
MKAVAPTKVGAVAEARTPRCPARTSATASPVPDAFDCEHVAKSEAFMLQLIAAAMADVPVTVMVPARAGVIIQHAAKNVNEVRWQVLMIVLAPISTRETGPA